MTSHGLTVLADGLGGHNAGEVASRRTVEGVIGRIQDYLGSHLGVPTIDEAREHLKKVIADINHALFEKLIAFRHMLAWGARWL